MGIPYAAAMDDTPTVVAPRILPPLTDTNRAFWTGGARGELVIMRGRDSQRLVHPPQDATPADGPLEPVVVSGEGTVYTFTINHQPFHPDVPPPYVIAIVELAEQADLRVPTNIVNCPIDEVRVGMPVRVLFEEHGEVFVPLFEPDLA